jgi:hypothetical protein
VLRNTRHDGRVCYTVKYQGISGVCYATWDMKRRTNYFAAWLGLLGIVLHALVPLAGMAVYGAPAAAAAHEHAGHAHGGVHVAHGAPAAPEQICVGDCPCCTTGYKSFVSSPIDLAWILPSLSGESAPPAPLLSIRTSEPNHDHSARAPPARS